VDYLLETADGPVPVEVKSGETIRGPMFAGLKFWSKVTGENPGKGVLVYGGREVQDRAAGHVIGWSDLPEYLKRR